MTTNYNVDNNLGPKKITADTSKVEPTEKQRPLPPVDKKEREEKFKKFLGEEDIVLTEESEEEKKPVKTPVLGTSPLTLMSGAIPSSSTVSAVSTDKSQGLDAIARMSSAKVHEGSTQIGGSKKDLKANEELVAASLVQPQPRPIEGAMVEAPKPVTDTQALLRKLVESCVKTLSEEIDPTKTTIRVELKLPIFKGATLEITQYNSAQKEFSLSFHNLTNPEARTLITANEQTLRTQLLEHGYTLQLVTIEPKLETSSHSATYEGTPRGRDQDQGQRQGQSFGRAPR